MAEEHLILRLLEQVLESECTPEEVCREFPDALAEVRARWLRVQAVEAEVEAIFPTPRGGGSAGGRTARPGGSFGVGSDPPRIPGYDIHGVLGSGGMGGVYKATHLKLKRTVAIKMLLAGTYAAPAELACLLREAEAVARFRHANIVQVYDVAELDGLAYFTMEYLEGGTLARKLGGMPQAPRDAAALVATLASAVEAAHQGGIVHRDLKPANILLTSSGTPKIVDFSLARQFAEESAVTLSTARVGTPSYMAPEQALGRVSAFCPSVDIYALGALLYEVLTGRPPFRAETPSETQRQVITMDPAPPSSLNARVPGDLETICLKCLEKDPQQRYPTAAAVAEDLQRFLRGEPITARRAGVMERAIKWTRRHPAHVIAIVCGTLIACGILGSGLWLGWRQAAVTRAVNEDLVEAVRQERSQDWADARLSLERARARLGGGGSAALRERIRGLARDLDLVTRLDSIRMARTSASDLDFDRAWADREYEVAFREAGLASTTEPPAPVAQRIAASEVRPAVVAAVDDWAICANGERRLWLLEVARMSDPDPRWRDRVRDVALWEDAAALAELAREARVAEEPMPVMLLLARLLDFNGGDAIGFMRRVQLAHPGDFWPNFVLAESLDGRGDPEAIGYYRAALAARPDAVAASVNLGIALTHHGRNAEAIDLWRAALRLDPNQAMLHHNLAITLLGQGLALDEVIEHSREAIRLSPEFAHAHSALGETLAILGRYGEAAPALARGLQLLLADDPVRERTTKLLARCERWLALEQKLPALVSGDTQPSDAAECLEIAGMLSGQKQYANAVRFYRDAIAGSAAIAEDVMSGNRYNAACCAALAAADGATSPEQRASLCGEALAWLRAELTSWMATLRSEDPRSPVVFRQAVGHWQVDADLSSLREEKYVKALPEKTREGLAALWKQVDTVLAQNATTQ